MKERKELINKILYPLLAFFIPVLIMIFLFYVKGGIDVEQLAIGDMQAQHIDMLLYFKKILTGEESMFYSIIKGIGGDMYSTMAYYMLSPINLILLFFEDTKIMYAIRLIILIKVGLCGLNMYFLLNSKNKAKKNYSLLFALSYALMAFVINNYFCTLWLDAVYLAPLVMMGIDKLINDKKVLLYMITLALCIFTNFYFGYMVCIFSVIYFIYIMVLKYKKEDKKEIIGTSVRFLISSLLSGLAVAVIYIPAILSVLSSDRTTIEANEATLMGVIYRMFAGSYSMDDFLSYYHPCIYCGLIIFPIIISFIFSKKISEKEKVLTLSIILFFLFSIIFHQMSWVWHGFSYPIGYNFRFSFLYCLFILIICHKQLCTMGRMKVTKALKYTLAIFPVICLMFVFKKFSILSGYVSVILLLVYSFLIFINKKKYQYVILALVIFELGFNAYNTFYVTEDHYTSRETLETDICKNIPNGLDFRVSGYEYYGTNENVACSFSFTKLFSTTINSRITNFYSKVGLAGGVNMYNDNLKNTPIVYSLLGVKYFYNKELMNDYELIKEFDVRKVNEYHDEDFIEKHYIYENQYALNLGFMIKKYYDETKEEIVEEMNFFDFQNNIIKNFTGIDKDVLIRVESGKNPENIIDSKYLYVFAYSDVYSIGINEDEYVEIPANEFIAFENKYNTNELNIEARNKDGSLAQIDVYYLDLENFLNAINNLKNNQVEDIKIDKNVIKGSIDVKEDGVLALSIPYEEGFRLYVDGEEMPITVLYDFFMGIELEAGNHTFELVYVPTTYKLGLVVSITAIVLAGIYVAINENEKFRNFCKKLIKKI